MAATSPSLEEFLSDLAARGSAPVSAWPTGLDLAPHDLGLLVDGVRVVPGAALDLLNVDALRRALPDFTVATHIAIDSTNSALLERAATQSVAQRVVTAECQLAGRGRRGRGWLSPFARSLAISAGFATGHTAARLGGLSLVVGIALADFLERSGARDVHLKWPNDLLFGDAKLAGILVELVQGATGVQIVVGIGVNVVLTAAERASIGQSVADVREAGVQVSRTGLVAGIVHAVAEQLQRFEVHGFADFIPAFNRRHAFHGRRCAVVQGTQRVVGDVVGVGEQGELLLATSSGVLPFVGGEVSLRPDRTG